MHASDPASRAGRAHAWLHRYQDCPDPTVGEVARAIGVRAVLPMLVLLTANLAIGFAIVGPGGGLPAEGAVNAALQTARTPLLDSLARIVSTMGNAPGNIGASIVFMGLLYWRTRRWWVALLPGLALSLEAIVHAVTSVLVGRPRPPVEQLDVAQPTASFPSGHVGATLAQVLILMFLLLRLGNAFTRSLTAILGLGFVLFLAWSRLYLGMHHVSDVAVGFANGIVCAVLAWGYLPVRRGDPG